MPKSKSDAVVIYCNYCGTPHEIKTGKSTCPLCKKPAGVRPADWNVKLWNTGKV